MERRDGAGRATPVGAGPEQGSAGSGTRIGMRISGYAAVATAGLVLLSCTAGMESTTDARRSGADAAPRPPPRDGGAPARDGSVDARDPDDPGGDASMAPPPPPPGTDAGTPPFVPPPGEGLCFGAAPPLGERPDPLPTYSGGACPELRPGVNRIRSRGADRQLILVVPRGYDGSESLPLIVMWPWLGGEASDFLERGEVQDGADRKRFIAAIMDEKGDLLDKWPWSILASPFRIDEELVFFDDVLACVAAQYEVNASCVSSVGVSAGALWTAQLASRRSTRLASIVSLSGGTGGIALPWSPARHAMPALVLWGGALDWCGLDFQAASQDMEAGLVAGRHFVVECIHNCGHGVPPFEPPPGEPTFAVMWDFVLDHPYWLAAGDSPWTLSGLPAGTPSWCAIGAGRAFPRIGGGCPGSGCF